MRSRPLLVLAVVGKLSVAPLHAQFADAVISYSPGTGASAGYTNATTALGQPSRVTPPPFGGSVDPFDPPWQTGQLVSIGAGGSLTVRLDTPLYHDRTHPFDLDLMVYGNAGFAITNNDYSGGGITDGSLFGANDGQTRVSVSKDGTNFFVLNPALAPALDALFPTDGDGDLFRPVDPALSGTSFAGLGLAGVRARYAGSAGGAGYSLAWAQDTNGRPVTMSGAQFVRLEVVSGKADIDAVSSVAPIGGGAVWWENFATNPLTRGWSIFGDTNLFRWNSTNENLEVTWDSSRGNSYFQLPLGTLLTRQDDFSVALDLELKDIAVGTTPGKPGTFQIAFGFINQSSATRTNFIRGTGSDSPNLVEFNFFPDSGYGPTVWPGVFDTNGVMNYSGSSDFSIFDLPIGVPMRVVLSFVAKEQAATLSVSTNGVLVGPITSARLMTNFTQFLLDTFAIASYSDAGQPPFMPGSILAHGVVDNLVVSAQPPVVRKFTGQFAEGGWLGSVLTRTNWDYTLQASTDFMRWTNVSTANPGNGQTIRLQDTNGARLEKRFYRINATPHF